MCIDTMLESVKLPKKAPSGAFAGTLFTRMRKADDSNTNPFETLREKEKMMYFFKQMETPARKAGINTEDWTTFMFDLLEVARKQAFIIGFETSAKLLEKL